MVLSEQRSTVRRQALSAEPRHPIDRAARDPQRKLSPSDRIFGTIQLALDYDITPTNMTKGAKAGIAYLLNQSGFDHVADSLLKYL